MTDVSVLNFGDGGGDRNVKDNSARTALTVTDNDDTGLIRFGVDANGNYGYKKVGADTVIPFKSGMGELTREYATQDTGSYSNFQIQIGNSTVRSFSTDHIIKAGEILLLYLSRYNAYSCSDITGLYDMTNDIKVGDLVSWCTLTTIGAYYVEFLLQFKVISDIAVNTSLGAKQTDSKPQPRVTLIRLT